MHAARFAFLALLTTVSNPARSEPTRAPALRKEMAVAGLGAFPQDAGDAPLDGPAYGVELSGGAGLVGWPITIGVDLRAVHWNKTTRRVNLSIANRSFPAEFARSDETAAFSAWLRVQPKVWRLHPFVEATVGLRGLAVNYSLHVQGADAPITSGEQALQPTWGLGGGIDFLIARATTTSEDEAEIYARVALRRNYGATIDISPETETGRAQLGLSADTTVYSVGIAFSFYDAF